MLPSPREKVLMDLNSQQFADFGEQFKELLQFCDRLHNLCATLSERLQHLENENELLRHALLDKAGPILWLHETGPRLWLHTDY